MLENDVVAIGSGWAGPWPSENYGPAHELRRFAEYAEAGDLVIAKHGKRLAMGIGVLGPYEFDADQDDIEGWDLCHIRRVRWLSKTEHRFTRLALSQGRFSGCNDHDVLVWVARTIGTADLRPPDRSELRALPALGPRLKTGQLSPELRRVVKRARSRLGTLAMLTSVTAPAVVGPMTACPVAAQRHGRGFHRALQGGIRTDEAWESVAPSFGYTVS